MAEQPRPRIYLAALILCMCFSSLTLLNIQRIAPLSLDSFSRACSDHQDISPQIEFESELALFGLVSLVSTSCRSIKYGQARLRANSITLTPHFPPPKAC